MSCKPHRTHAVLPEGIVPYRWHGLQFIVEAVARVYNDEKKEHVADELDVCVRTISRWEEVAAADLAFMHGMVQPATAQLQAIRSLVTLADQARFLYTFARIVFEHLRL